jgi:electron transfer flavoprotein beta subunit
MEIAVCIKRVPDTSEAEVVIAPDEKSIKTDRLPFDINEADNYATEEAILLKEKYGGSVTMVTVGKEDSKEQLRACLAKGADRAIRLDDEKFVGSDGYAIAKILHGAIKDLKFDLVLTGCMADDDGYGQVGVQLAQLLGIPHACLVTKIEVQDKRTRIHRELEGGLDEVLDIELPAVLAVQTGINEPRYASFKGIREAMKKEIKILGLADIGLKPEDVGEPGSKIKLEELFVPPVGERAQILEGTPEETSSRLAEILKEKGLI